MNIKLYQNFSDAHRLSKRISLVQEFTGTLKDSCSILDPVFIIEGVQDDVPTFVNYCYIPEFKRYYFITGIESIRNRAWAFSCHVDVLMTYKSEILNTGAWIARQENVYNLYLDDERFLINAPRSIWVKAFPNKLQTGGMFILTVAGGEGVGGRTPPTEPPSTGT